MKLLRYLILLFAFAALAQRPGFKSSDLATLKPVAASAKRTATDTFDRANADPISNPMSDGVYSWEIGPGALGTIDIVSNEAQAGADGVRQGACVSFADTWSADQKATITIGSGTIAGQGVLARVQSSSNAGSYLVIVGGTTTLQVYRVDDSGSIVPTKLGADITVSTIVEGDTVGISTSGTTITAYHNDVSVGTRTDSTYTSGNPGIYFSLASRKTSSWTATEL